MHPLTQWQQLGHYVSAHGQQIFVVDNEKESELPPVLLLHGYPCSSWDFKELYAELARTRRVLTLDFLGFGFSAKPFPHRYNIQQQANIVEAILTQQQLPACHVITHNYGDAVVLELLTRELSLPTPSFASVMFLGSALFHDTETPTLYQRVLAGPGGATLSKMLGHAVFYRSYVRLFGRQNAPSKEALNATQQLISHDKGRRCVPVILQYKKERAQNAQRWADAIANTNVPLAVLRGKEDPVVDYASLSKFKRLRPQQHFVVQEDKIGHYPHLEAPALVFSHWQRFLKQHQLH